MTIQNITPYLDAAFPFVVVETFDESRVLAELKNGPRKFFSYTASGYLRDGDKETKVSWADAFKHVAEQEDAVLFVQDLQHVVHNAAIYRAILECGDALKEKGSAIVAVGPVWKLPNELKHNGPVVRQELPTRDDLIAPLQAVAEAGAVSDEQLEPIQDDLLEAAAGLTLAEAENAFALALVECRELCPDVVQREKMRLLGSTGFLTVEKPRDIDSLGGLGQLKDYFRDEVAPSARDLDLQVRGVLLAGLPGGGKSLSAKVAAALLGVPLVRLDVSACKEGLVGASEANIRQATALVEAIAPCVLWIDEVEKGVAGATNSGVTDGGTSSGMLGHLLTWLQEHRKPILTVATCNDYQALPPEFTRAGRFDERFVIDLPTDSERVAIAEVHLRRLDCSAEWSEWIADQTKDWTGAEIEQLVKSAARLSQRQISIEHLERAKDSVKPLSETAKDKVTRFREWSKNALRGANDIPPKVNRLRRKLAAASAE